MLTLYDFKDRFQEPIIVRPNLDGFSFNELSSEDRNGLKAPFSLQDIKDVIWNADEGNNPGAYGFFMEFYKFSWDIIKYDMFECINVFFCIHIFLRKFQQLSFL